MGVIMWKLKTYKGEQIYYEAELIEKIKEICKKTCNYNDNCDSYSCYECKFIDEEAAIKRILDLIKDYSI